MYVAVVRINFSAAFVYRHEYRLNATCSLSHKACCACRSYCKAGYVAASVFSHFIIKCRVSLLYAVYERIVLFTFCVVNLECSTFFGHIDRRAVSFYGKSLMYLYREICSFLCAIAQTHCSYHVAFSCDAYTCTATQSALVLNLLP